MAKGPGEGAVLVCAAKSSRGEETERQEKMPPYILSVPWRKVRRVVNAGGRLDKRKRKAMRKKTRVLAEARPALR